MMDGITCLMVITVVVILIVYWLSIPDRRLPPCPMRPLPIVGHLLAMKKDQRVLFNKWRKQCGDIFSLYMGSKLIVVISGYDLIKETFIQRGEDFADRPLIYLDDLLGRDSHGIAGSSGKVWKEQRALILQILRNFGLGKNELAERIQEEVHRFTHHLSGFNGQPVDLKVLLDQSTACIICSILFGERLDYTDANMRILIDNFQKIICNINLNGLPNFVPLLKYFPGDMFKLNESSKVAHEMLEAVEKLIDECRGGDRGENLVAQYAAEQERRVKCGESTTLSEKNMGRAVYDLFSGGTETTSTTIYWLVLYLLNHPDVQDKIYDEIAQHVGTHRPPTILDKPRLTYLNAAIMETQRLASIVPHSLPHTCPRDVNVKGYVIPKGSYVVPNLDSVLHDDQIWGPDVMRFKPERFIDGSGELKQPPEFIPFSAGRRICLGESMARQEMFLYASNMCQRFEFVPKSPSSPPSTQYVYLMTSRPQPYQVRILQRTNE